MHRIEQFVKKLLEPHPHREAHALFTSLVYAWFLVQAAILWPERELIWGSQSVLLRYGATPGILENLMYRLMYQPTLFPAVYYIHLLTSMLAIPDYRMAFIPRFISWSSGLMLFYAGIPAYNSGMLLMLLLAFYSVPVFLASVKPWQSLINRFAFAACTLQVVLCYAFSGIYKLTGMQWLEGSAVYYTMHIERFSHSWMEGEQTLAAYAFLRVLSYSALAYQLVFPFVIWFGRHRSWLLWTGAAFHLAICVFLSLWDFGLAMLFCYALFLGEGAARRFRRPFGRKGNPSN